MKGCHIGCGISDSATLNPKTIMQLSTFTELISDSKGQQYLFNFSNKKWFKLDSKLAHIFEEHRDSIAELKDIHPTFSEALCNESFVVSDRQHDLQNAITTIEREYNSYDNIQITINPTLDCNLRCWYCYEKHRAGSVMSEETKKNAIAHIRNTIEQHDVKNLHLSFFGGEPLLHYKNTVRSIIEEVISVCNKSNTNLALSFTTNGLLITDQLLRDLEEWRIPTNFQIAFDGGRQLHDSVKYINKDSSCYKISLANVKKALDKEFNVSVRCNYDKKTISSFEELLEDLKAYHDYPNLRFMFQQIWQESDDQELVQLKKEFFKRVDSLYNINSNHSSQQDHSLQKCYADYKHNYVINYDGLIFKCTAQDFIEENSIGTLTEKGLQIKESEIYENKAGNIPYGKGCLDCRILPICPTCYRHRKEQKFLRCPINIDDNKVLTNIKMAFSSLSGVEIKI